MKTIATILAACLLLAGCASYGTKIDMAQVANIKKGVTTRGEMERMFGAPMNVTLMPDGRTAAMWMYTEASNSAQNFIPIVNIVQTKMDMKSQGLQVIYAADGIVESFTTNQGNSTARGGIVK